MGRPGARGPVGNGCLWLCVTLEKHPAPLGPAGSSARWGGPLRRPRGWAKGRNLPASAFSKRPDGKQRREHRGRPRGAPEPGTLGPGCRPLRPRPNRTASEGERASGGSWGATARFARAPSSHSTGRASHPVWMELWRVTGAGEGVPLGGGGTSPGAGPEAGGGAGISVRRECSAARAATPFTSRPGTAVTVARGRVGVASGAPGSPGPVGKSNAWARDPIGLRRRDVGPPARAADSLERLRLGTRLSERVGARDPRSQNWAPGQDAVSPSGAPPGSLWIPLPDSAPGVARAPLRPS